MGALRIGALGPLDVIAGGSPVVVKGGKQRIVLACLALRANSVVTADFLADVLWGDHPPARPGPQMQVYLANLRGLLEPGRPPGVGARHLLSRPGGYSLVVGEDELDLLQFRWLVALGQNAALEGNLPGAATCFRQAVRLFRGSPFPDLADIQAFRAELDQLEEMKLDTYQNLADIELARGRHSLLTGDLQRLVTNHPYREKLWESLALALYRDGRQADALAACRSARKVMVQDLGIEPSERLKELEILVLQQDQSLDAPAVGFLRQAEKVNSVPPAVTPMLGRDSEFEEVCSLYKQEGCRLVTVTGPGGTGKTRLALAVASHIGETMDDGVGWVSMATLTHPEQVPAAIASSLGLGDFGADEPLKMASRFLRQRRLLLVLDNFEHLEKAWPVVLDLLTGAPELRILATSRRRLGLRAEYEFELPPLALPPLDHILPPDVLREVPAVKLFLARGRAVRRHFGVDESNASLLTRVCHRVDGLPLAIELAAAQLRHHSLEELLGELEQGLTSLPGAFRDLPGRQQTITATIAWSYRLLGKGEQELFDHLGVFAANPTTTAVRSICCCVADSGEAEDAALGVLLSHSLVRCYTDTDGNERVGVLHSIREFARQRLLARADADAVYRRHASYYLQLAETLAPALWGYGQISAFRELKADTAEFRSALLWATGQRGSDEVALGLIGHLWHYWELTGNVLEQYREAVKLVERAPDVPPAVLAPALSGAATLSWIVGRYDQAATLHHRAAETFREAGNQQGVAWSLMCLSVQAAQSEDLVLAERLALEALTTPGRGYRTRVSALIVLSRVAYHNGRYDAALELAQECARLARPLGDGWLWGVVLTNLAESLEQAGELDAAERHLQEAVSAAFDLGAYGSLAAFLESLAGICVKKHRPDPAIRMLSATDAYRSDRGVPLEPAERRRIESFIAQARAEAGPVRFGLAWAAGRALTLAQAVAEAADLPQDQDDIRPVEGRTEIQAVAADYHPSTPWS
ncbi:MULTISPECIES: BTAD domain-containing putative transcriptional regulator [Pseudarthrobacter]|uniref:ATPase/DNA-binding SARP family transcriptional activator n=1 Tax=Pseudarthrobacter niigatensis TaxID=369935 RepID=A0AAJ1WGJ6_9MICC|nr:MULTISPECIES: BTAD domain-containing putative transcriptional regulator [Pseudarthrobacter]MDQ0146805.1 putative ATPase/DNA-binding SARP family transcriptional activator [Pseudarthrobacter niigatensis]MDQ0264649.1 putative ATPase/DNA-binding SARP family transcriptional activator [Pseudarthrobacter niigatensis]QDG87567.1 hypothetical protein NIBR502770_02980 [Pseudarthrobacter sp. NIBRBAC000502770]